MYHAMRVYTTEGAGPNPAPDPIIQCRGSSGVERRFQVRKLQVWDAQLLVQCRESRIIANRNVSLTLDSRFYYLCQTSSP